MELIELTNTDRRFYTVLGPFLADRAVIKAVGGPVWDDDTKTWLVLRDKKKGVLGFCAIALHGNRTVVESLYTLPGLNRVASELVGAAVARYGKRELHAVVRHQTTPAYLDAGFKTVGTTKEFTKLTRAADGGANA